MVHRAEVETERNGKKHCLQCRNEAFRRRFVWYCNCDEIKEFKED
jgi:ribosomal protein L37AE/L43A